VNLSRRPRKKAARWRERVAEIHAERDSECARLYKAGLSVWAVSMLMDVSQEHIRTALAKAGDKPRARGGNPRKP
jgi:hypothetical protein